MKIIKISRQTFNNDDTLIISSKHCILGRYFSDISNETLASSFHKKEKGNNKNKNVFSPIDF